MMEKRSDPVIDEIRAIRQRISARFDHDPARLVAYYIELQERHRDRLIDRPKAPERGEESAVSQETVGSWKKLGGRPFTTRYDLALLSIAGHR